MKFITYISKNIISRVYALKEKSYLFSYLRTLENSQWMPLAQLRERQLEKLKKILIHAYETTEFYKKRFDDSCFNPYKLVDIDEIKNIPLLTKKDITENVESIKSKLFNNNNLLKAATGGSTGIQLHFFIDKESNHKKNACAWRHNRWAGWDIGMPVAAVWGNPPKATTFKKKLRNKFLDHYIYLDTMDMTPSSMEDFVSKINRQVEYVLFGHSHSQYLLAKFIQDNRLKIKKTSGIVSTSMMLMENERQLIENVFSQKVTNRYGCEEVSLIGSECELHNGFHLNIDHLVVEFIKDNGEDAKPNEEGRLILTDLSNFGMPFIRYEVGDIGVPSDRMCKCGRGLPLMERVVGRTADFLVRKDGSLVAGVSLIERFLTKIPGIHQMQIVQDEIDTLKIKIVKDKSFSDEISIAQLKKEFECIFPESLLQIYFTDIIPKESSGKYRFSICNIRH